MYRRAARALQLPFRRNDTNRTLCAAALLALLFFAACDDSASDRKSGIDFAITISSLPGAVAYDGKLWVISGIGHEAEALPKNLAYLP